MKKEITTKDLMALNELMTFENWMAIKMKGCHDCSDDRTLKTMFKDMAKKHSEHHAKLLNYLRTNMEEGGNE